MHFVKLTITLTIAVLLNSCASRTKPNIAFYGHPSKVVQQAIAYMQSAQDGNFVEYVVGEGAWGRAI